MDLDIHRRKNRHVNSLEDEGRIADSKKVRLELIEKMERGEIDLYEMQDMLKKIKRNAKKNGQITREAAYRKG